MLAPDLPKGRERVAILMRGRGVRERGRRGRRVGVAVAHCPLLNFELIREQQAVLTPPRPSPPSRVFSKAVESSNGTENALGTRKTRRPYSVLTSGPPPPASNLEYLRPFPPALPYLPSHSLVPFTSAQEAVQNATPRRRRASVHPPSLRNLIAAPFFGCEKVI